MANVLTRLGGRKRNLVGTFVVFACNDFIFAHDEDFMCCWPEVAGRIVPLDDKFNKTLISVLGHTESTRRYS